MQIVFNNVSFDQLRELRDQFIKYTDAVALNHGQYACESKVSVYSVEYIVPTISVFVGTKILGDFNVITIDLKDEV